MESFLGHIQININPDNVGFYRDLMAMLAWTTLYDDNGMLGVSDGGRTSLWFVGPAKEVAYDYDGPGVNHLALGVGAQGDVDIAADWLQARGVEHLFGTPQHRPDFAEDESQTYYQVMFESPDGILLEVVYTGPKQ